MEMFGIDNLIAELIKIKSSKHRLTHEELDDIFVKIFSEIPYASQVLPTSLAEILLHDTPHKSTNIVLNEIVAYIGLALCNPTQKDELTSIVKTYLHSRKESEKAYATEILKDVLKQEYLQAFPESAQTALRGLAHSVLERIINEKRLRKLPDYKPFSLMELINPIVHYRLPNLELERAKATQHFAFRKLINSVAQEGYAKIIDEKRLHTIVKEKHDAFDIFYQSIIIKVPKDSALKELQKHLLFAQKDKAQKQQILKKQLDEFLNASDPKILSGLSSLQLRSRITDKFKRLFHNTDINPAIYANAEATTEAHRIIFNEIVSDVKAIKNLMIIVANIKTNFKKNLLHTFSGKKTFHLIEVALTDVLLGQALQKPDPVTGHPLLLRENGYPRESISQIYAAMSQSLYKINGKVTGIFADKLRMEINAAINYIQTNSKKFASEWEKVANAVKAEAIPEKNISEPLFTEEETLATHTPKQTDVEPIALVEDKKLDVAPITLEPIEKMSPKPLIEEENLDIEPIALEPVKKVTPPPLEEENDDIEPITLEAVEKVISKPLFAEDIVPEEPIEKATIEKITVPPLHIEDETEIEPIILEPVKPQPLFIDDINEIEPIQLEPIEKVTPSPSLDSSENAGAAIIKNYQLGEFKQPVLDAWKKMAGPDAISVHDADAIALPSDNEIRLYVICDLVQQVAAIEESNLSATQKQILQNVKHQILDALEDPMLETNWHTFEGIRRDNIDKTLTTLKSA